MKLIRRQLERLIAPSASEVTTGLHPEAKPVYFDSEIDIQPYDWDASNETLEDLEGIVILWDRYLRSAAAMAMVYPERRDEISFSDQKFDEILRYIRRGENFNIRMLADWLSSLVILRPDRVSELGLGEQQFVAFRDALEKERVDMVKFLEFAKQLVILFPSRRNELGLNEKRYHEIVEQRFFDLEHMKIGDLVYLEALVIIFPEHKSELPITEDDILGLKRRIDEHRRSDRAELSICQARLKILAADEVRISAPGVLEFIEHEPLRPLAGLPERSKV